MTASANKKVNLLPTWLREVIDEGEPADGLLNKREQPRTIARPLISAQRNDQSNASPFPEKLWNTFDARLGSCGSHAPRPR